MLKLRKLYTSGVWTGVDVLKYSGRHRFTPRFVKYGIKHGFITEMNKRLTIYSPTRAFVYKQLQAPGTYCCFCNKALSNGAESLHHVRAHFATGESNPDRQNPSGYRRDEFYDVELVCILKPRG